MLHVHAQSVVLVGRVCCCAADSCSTRLTLHLHAHSVVVVDWVFMACFACITWSLCTSKVAHLPSTLQHSLVEGAAMERTNNATL